MLMTYASPELLPPTAGSAEQADLPVGCRHLEPDGQSRDERKSTFELQFSRSRRLLHFVARRILKCVEKPTKQLKTAASPPLATRHDSAAKAPSKAGWSESSRRGNAPSPPEGNNSSKHLRSTSPTDANLDDTVDTLEGHQPHGPKVVGDSAPAEQSPNPRTRIRAPKPLKPNVEP